MSQGIHFVGLDYVKQYPIKTQSIKQRVAVATSNGKKTDVKISYSYHVDPSKAVAIIIVGYLSYKAYQAYKADQAQPKHRDDDDI